MWDYLQPLIVERRSAISKFVETDLNTNRTIHLNDLHTALCKCTEKAVKSELQEKKGESRYLVISTLHSSFFSNKHDTMISLHDDRYLSDLTDCSSYYSYAYLMNSFNEDIDAFSKAIKKSFVRVMDYEIDDIRFRYKKETLDVLTTMSILLLLNDPMIIDSINAGKIPNNLVISIGDYGMNQKALLSMKV